ncbi:MAG: hypothetical protein A3F11_03560 [Gammaproteobacteria bacterium RIFCSPHIGHO2_12_FULL_37_14]|nr:MAG: hypothetical protein A3F11_03560 [Gammaproteobacteria bacterium RIFCSPHIGHO2_12_FULL_37_14]
MEKVTVGDSYFQELYFSIQENAYCNALFSQDMQPDFEWSPVLNHSLNKKIFDILNNRGFVLVSIEANTDIHNITTWQNKFLGLSMEDRGHDKGFYSTVMAEKDGKFFVNSNLTQPIHTDEGHTSLLPRYISLYCKTSSTYGGITTLVDSAKLIKILENDFGNKMQYLFDKEAIQVRNVSGCESKNILMLLPDGRTGISYSPILRELTCNKTIFEMYSVITKYVHDPLNQIRFKLAKNHLLILDNCRVLHGRTKFLISDDRILYRMWFSKCRLNSELMDLAV